MSVMWNQYTNDSCLPNPLYPCSDKGYPAFVLNASTSEHVKLGVDFARNKNIRLVVRSTGHDYVGRSTGAGALSIWTRHLNNIVYHRGDFVPAGSSTPLLGNAITVGGGSHMSDILTAVGKHGEVIVAGNGKTVGVSGYITGGGHSALSPYYGMATDQVLQIEVVTPKGDIAVANDRQNSDLFWALRGGGGSTFGIITSLTLKTYPSPSILSVDWSATAPADASFKYDLITYILSEFKGWMDNGLSGYNSIFDNIPNPSPAPSSPVNVSGAGGTMILLNVGDANIVQNILGATNQTIRTRWKEGSVSFTSNTTSYESFNTWFSTHYDKGSAGYDVYLVSRLIDGKTLSSSQKALKLAIRQILQTTKTFSAFLVGGKGVGDAKPPGDENALNHAWRKTYVHVIAALPFAPLNKTSKQLAIDSLDSCMEPLRKLTPEMGAYVNEALPYEKNWKTAFWGGNYERLEEIKRKVDPSDVLWCFPCVGHERWRESEDGRLCRV
ncbi:FAD-binding, type 2 [Paramyrothecium foliicola]|nr:FAD-binding, type 2 [Paramyrothecium foliicola]